jgi:hypothetical protein
MYVVVDTTSCSLEGLSLSSTGRVLSDVSKSKLLPALLGAAETINLDYRARYAATTGPQASGRTQCITYQCEWFLFSLSSDYGPNNP